MEIFDTITNIMNESPNPIMLEFGACDFYHTKIFIDILEQTKKKYQLFSFEPTYLFDKHIECVTKNGKFKAIKKAIGQTNGIVDFWVSDGVKYDENGKIQDSYYGSSSIRKPKLVLESWPEMTFSITKTDVITLDTFYQNELNDSIVDFIWADIQGAEIDLILGGIDTLNNKTRYLYTEYCDRELYEGEIGLNNILRLLPDFELIKDYDGDVLLKNKRIK